MSLHLIFMGSKEIYPDVYLPSVAWSDKSRPTWTHVEIIIDDIGLCSFTGRPFDPSISSDTNADRKYNYQVVRLPESLKDDVLRRYKTLRFTVPYRHRDYVRAAREGHCARSLLKTGFTCATFVSYLLGVKEYYKMSPDMVYNLLK